MTLPPLHFPFILPGSRHDPPANVTTCDAHLEQFFTGPGLPTLPQQFRVPDDPEEMKSAQVRLAWRPGGGADGEADDEPTLVWRSTIKYSNAEYVGIPNAAPVSMIQLQVRELRTFLLFAVPTVAFKTANAGGSLCNQSLFWNQAEANYVMEIRSRMLIDQNGVPFGAGLPSHTGGPWPPTPTATEDMLEQLVKRLVHDLGWIYVRRWGW